MLKLLLISLAFLSPLYAVAPVSGTVGKVQCTIVPESITETALKAATEEYTEAWLDKYAVDKISFGEAYSEILSSSLPLDNPIAGEEKNNAVTLRSLADGTILSFVFADGRIAAVSESP